MTTDLDAQAARLREAAQKATPGPWDFRWITPANGFEYAATITGAETEGGGYPVVADLPPRSVHGTHQANSEFIALANPATILALLDEREALANAHDHYKELAEKGLEPRVRKMSFESGEFDMQFTGDAANATAAAFVGYFKGIGATNFVEMNLYDREEPFQRYTVTVQKIGAKSPADLLNAAEAERDALRAERDEAVRNWEREAKLATSMAEDCNAAEAEAAALRKALEPFAKRAPQDILERYDDESPVYVQWPRRRNSIPTSQMEIGHFRAAVSALTTKGTAE